MYLVENPEMQEKAAKDIEEAIGFDQAPTLLDREKLPYILALSEEVLRHCPMAALNVPHMALEDAT